MRIVSANMCVLSLLCVRRTPKLSDSNMPKSVYVVGLEPATSTPLSHSESIHKTTIKSVIQRKSLFNRLPHLLCLEFSISCLLCTQILKIGTDDEAC